MHKSAKHANNINASTIFPISSSSGFSSPNLYVRQTDASFSHIGEFFKIREHGGSWNDPPCFENAF